MDTVLVALGVVFLVLKLTNVITWSWLAVLSPFLVLIGLSLIMFLLGLLGMSVLRR